MKILVCIDGGPAALQAAQTAGRLSRFRANQVCFLFVRRSGRRSRGYNISEKAAQVFSTLKEPFPELRYLAEAQKAFSDAGGLLPDVATLSSRQEALIQVGKGIFEKATVDICSSDDMTCQIREGFPHEEILKEANRQTYDLILLGGRRTEACRWYEAENIPLSVMQKSPCAVLVVQKPIPDQGTFLMLPGKKQLSPINWQLISGLALGFNSHLHILTTSAKNHAGIHNPSELNSQVAVTREALRANPLQFISECKSEYALYICPPNRSIFFPRANKRARKIFCSGYNTLTLR